MTRYDSLYDQTPVNPPEVVLSDADKAMLARYDAIYDRGDEDKR